MPPSSDQVAIIPIDQIAVDQRYPRRIDDTLRERHWSTPGDTRHIEYTVTEMCYLIEADTPCSGCTLVGVQRPEPGINVDVNLPIDDEDRYKVNVPFVVDTLEQLVDSGHNLVTLMGGEPLTIKHFEQVITWVAQHPTLSGLIYSSSAYYLKPDGTPNHRLQQHEDAGLFDRDFGYFKSSVDMLILDESELPEAHHPRRGDAYKSFKGLQLIEYLAAKGYPVAIHQTLKDYTLDDTLRLYEWAKQRGVMFTMCPMVWQPYVAHGKSELFYSAHLTSEHAPQLREIVDYVTNDTISRFHTGQQRICNDSSAFLRLMPEFGPNNTLSCRVHRQGTRPNGRDIHPNQQARWCIAQNSHQDGLDCPGCFYKGIDRDGDYWNFENLAGGQQDMRWVNGDVAIKSAGYDPTGENLFFDALGNQYLREA